MTGMGGILGRETPDMQVFVPAGAADPPTKTLGVSGSRGQTEGQKESWSAGVWAFERAGIGKGEARIWAGMGREHCGRF